MKGWEKYTTASGESKSQSMAAFSHFTFVATEGYLIVDQLQGKGFLLSNPLIHCGNKEQFSGSYN